MANPTFLTKAELAAHLQRSPRTIDNWHARGLITAYRGEDGKLRFALETVELAMKMQPFQMRDGRRRGTSGNVLPMPIQAAEDSE